MKLFSKNNPAGRFISAYEIMIWFFFAGVYKYADFADSPELPRLRTNFPFPVLFLYGILLTLYVIPYYRFVGPWLLKRKWYVVLFFFTIVYFLFASRAWGYVVSYWFNGFNSNEAMQTFFQHEVNFYSFKLKEGGWQLPVVMMDILAFVSVMFLQHSVGLEQKKHNLETDNLQLQLQTLKMQLHPHFLFNTLNSIYGMSLVGEKDTSSFILRLSDMMRYMLYDCRKNYVPLEKDVEFLRNYLEMEKKRYPDADIAVEIRNETRSAKEIAPLMFIPFLENAFKHGSQRVSDTGFIRGHMICSDKEVFFELFNSVWPNAPDGPTDYGGVGIENVRKRLELYYPGRHELQIRKTPEQYIVNLKISLGK